MIDLTTPTTQTDIRVMASAGRPAARRSQWRAVAVAAVVTVVAVALAIAGSIAITAPPPPAPPAQHAATAPAGHVPDAVPTKAVSGQAVPPGLHNAITNHDGLQAATPRTRGAKAALDVRYGPDGTVRVGSGSHILTLTPTAFGRGAVQPLGAASRTTTADGPAYDFGPLSAWYQQPKRAELEQGFTVSGRPAGPGGDVTIATASQGNVVPTLTGSHSVVLRSGAATAFTDDGLRVTDASGRVLPSHFTVSGRDISIVYADAGATYPVTVDPWIETAPLLPNGEPGVFGTSVAISSDGLTAIVGDPGGAADANASLGEATIYYDNTGNWSAGTALLVPANAIAFGTTVALSANGTTALVGDPSALTPDLSTTVGGAYVYTLTGTTWSPPTALAVPATAASFGSAVSLSGDGLTALVGDPSDSSGSAVGEAWVYTNNGTTWSASPTGLTVPATATVFGTAVALSANTTTSTGSAVIGDPGGGSGTGAATVFTLSGGVWTAGLSPTPPAHAASFGFAVDVDATTTHVIVGDPSGGTTGKGAATLYAFSAGAWHATSLTDTTAQAFGTVVSVSEGGTVSAVGDPTANVVRTYTGGTGLTFKTPTGAVNYGSAVSLDSVGTELLIGDPIGTPTATSAQTGIATYSHFTTGPGWSAASEFNELGGPGSYGSSVALSTSGQTAIVGDTGGGPNLTGAATIFTYANGAWDGGSQLPVPTNTVLFGSSVALSGDGLTAIVGDSGGGAANTGAATIYTLNGKTWVQGTSLNPPATAQTFGTSVALDGNGNEAVVGDPLDSAQFDGGADVYTETGSVWSTTAVQLALPFSANFFGASVSLSSDGNTALIGDFSNAATVFTQSGSVWSDGTALVVPAHAVAFGASVSLDAAGTEAIVGDPSAKPASTTTGAATVYSGSGSTWSTGTNLSLPADAKSFGYSVQLSSDGGSALVGDYIAQTDALTTGAANSYTGGGSTWSAPSALTPPANSVNFGSSVAIADSGQVALVGDPSGGDLGNGAATTYSLPASGTQLAITTSPVIGAAGTSAGAGPITVQLETSADAPFDATSPITVNLASTSIGGVFATSGHVPTTSVVIPMGSSSTSFFYGDTVAGSPNITASATGLSAAHQAETITPGPTTKLAVTSSPNASAGTSLPVTVTAEDAFNNTTPSYAGTVHFTSSDGSASLPANYTFTGGDAGVHIFGVSFVTGGSQTVTATDTVTGSITGTDSVTVRAGTAVAPMVTPTTVIAGNSVTYHATVTSGTAGTITGSVTFTINSVTMCIATPLSAGSASCTSSLAPTGSDTVTASYGGDVNFSPSTNTTPLTVNPPLSISTTTLPGGTVGVAYNQSVTAAGGQAPYGGWAVHSGSLPAGTTINPSTGAIAGTPLSAGTFTFTVSVTDSETAPVTVDSATLQIIVGLGTPTVTAEAPSPASADVNQSVIYTATVTGGGAAPTGTVTFTIGATTLCAPTILAGTATCSASNAPIGTGETVTATYGGDLNYSGGSGTTSITVVVPASAYTAVTPYRICDTRGANGLVGTNAQCAGQTLSAGGTLPIQVTGTNPSGTGSGGVPASGVAAVVLNVTATGEAAQGFITVWPSDASRPSASSLNYRPNKTVPNLVTVGVSATGQVSFYSLQGTNLVVDVEGYYAAPSGTAGLFNSVTPYRICDTRAANGLVGTNAQCVGHPLTPGGTLTLQVTGTNPSGTGSGGVPASGVSAVVLNVTAIGHGTGFITAFPQGVSPPTASNLNFSSGQVVPNRVIVPVSATGQVSLTTNTSADVVVDVNGWFTDGSSDLQTGALFVATTPTRICDTRVGNATACSGHTLTGPGTLDVAVAGQGPVPASGVVAVVANVTAADTTAQSYLTAWPKGQPQPTASDLNWVAGLNVPNMAVVGLGTSGDISVFVFNGNADVIVDVTGWYVNAP